MNRLLGWPLSFVGDFCFDEERQEGQGFLPAEIAGLDGNESRDAFLGDVYFGATEDLGEGDGGDHLAGEVGIIEGVGIADAFVGLEFEIGAAKGVALARAEISKGHLEGAAHAGIHAVHFASEPVWRKPFGNRVCIEKGAVNALRFRAEDAVKVN